MRGNYFTTCLMLHVRRAIARLPLLLAMALAALLLGLAGAAAGSQLFAGQQFAGLQVAIAQQQPDPRLDEMLALAGQMDSLRDTATLHSTTPAQAREMLRTGQATAAIILPAGFLDSVYSGENLSPQVLLDAGRPLDAALVRSLAESAAILLDKAQQGITFTIQTYQAQGTTTPALQQVILDINLRYITWVLGHSSMYKVQTVAATGALSVGQFYLLSACLYLVLLALPVLHPLYALAPQRAWLGRLRAAGGRPGAYAMAQILAGTLPLFFMLGLLVAALGLAFGGHLASLPVLLPALLVLALLFSCFGFLLGNLGSAAASTGLCFLLATGMLVAAGGFIPTILLPAGLAALEPWSPLGWMRALLAPLFGAPSQAGAWLRLSLLLAASLAAALLPPLLQAARQKQKGVQP